MSKKVLIAIGIVVIAIGAFVVFQQANPSSSSQSTAPSSTIIQPQKEEAKTIEGYSGALLAGKTSPYLEFNKADYEKALSQNKIIFLDFYANWCPICRVEAPELQAGFNDLSTDSVVGFRVNFNDSDTSEEEKALAKEFGVTYQHTKVILQDGKPVLKSGDQWDKAEFLKQINAVISK